MNQRNIEQKIDKFLDSRQVLVITGARRVGKTTILKRYFSQNQSRNKLYLNFEDVLTRKIFEEENYLNVVRSLQEEGLSLEQKAYIYIDEIQYVRNAPSVIKYLYDEFDIKFMVTGSSSYYLRNRFSESLAGRKFIIEMFPLTFSEFLIFKGVRKTRAESFAEKSGLKSHLRAEKYNDLYSEYIRFGGFPEVVLARDAETKNMILRDIITSYFQIDVANLANFKDVGKLRDLLQLLSQRVGSKLDVTTLAGSLQISRNNVYEYLEFLQSTYIIQLIAQKSSFDNQVSAAKKLYFLDTGLVSILGNISEVSQLENSVFMNLRDFEHVTFYEASSGKEIDFVINGKIGLEVKSSPAQKYVSYLKKRAESAGLDTYYLVSTLYQDMPELIMAWDL